MPDPIDPSGNYDWDPATQAWVARFPVPEPPPAHAAPASVYDGSSPGHWYPVLEEGTNVPAPKKHTARNVLGIGAIVVLLVIAGSSLAGGTSSGGGEPAAAPVTPSAAAPTPSDEPVADPGPDPAVLQQYVDETTNIAATAQAMSEAAFAEDVDALTEACETLGDDAKDGLALPDTNVPGVDKQWDAAMNDYSTAALNCAVSDYDRAASFINSATGHITKATDAIAAYAG